MNSNLDDIRNNATDEVDDESFFTNNVYVGVILSCITLTSIVGNILVCLAIYTDRTLRKIGNLFLVSLAIADLFVACLVMTFAVANDFMGRWEFGPQFCDTWVAFDVMCCTSSILNLCAISLDKYICIKDPLRYGRWMTKNVILGSITGIWLVSALVSFLPISLDLHRMAKTTPPPDPPTCALELSPTYAVVSSCISFYAPCVIMIFLYAKLYMYARMHVRNIRAVTMPLNLGDGDSTGSSPANNPGSNRKQHNSSLHVSDHKAAVTIGFIVGTFLVCWVPFFCINIVTAFCVNCIPLSAFQLLTWLGYCNSALNPIIYSIFNQEFRKAFRRILLGHAGRASCCGCDSYSVSRNGRRGRNDRRRPIANGQLRMTKFSAALLKDSSI